MSMNLQAMKNIVVVLFLIIGASTYGQIKQPITLRWKIDKNDTLVYATVMRDQDTSTIETNFGFMSKAFSDSSDKASKKNKDFMKQLSAASSNQDYLTTLTNKGNGIIDIIMTIKEKEEARDSIDKKMAEFMTQLKSVNKGIMLRGSVYETGEIHSFWIKNAQKNLVAILFELPARPVKIGDKWQLNVSLIGNDQNFECDSSYKLNEVQLVDVKKVNGDTIASLKYNIIEYVDGNFLGGRSMMKFSHRAVAEFSVKKGRWISYDGMMSIDSIGIMSGSKKTKFSLVEEKAADK